MDVVFKDDHDGKGDERNEMQNVNFFEREVFLGHGQNIQKQQRHIQIMEREVHIKKLRTVGVNDISQLPEKGKNTAEFGHGFGQQKCGQDAVAAAPVVFLGEEIAREEDALEYD